MTIAYTQWQYITTKTSLSETDTFLVNGPNKVTTSVLRNELEKIPSGDGTCSMFVSASNDESGDTDIATIRTAINTLQASGTETKTLILFGNVYINDTIEVLEDPGIMFEGVNCTITQITADTPTIQFSGLTSGGCRGIKFIATTEDDDAIEVDGCTNLIIEDCDFSNYTRYGTAFDGTCSYCRFDSLKEDAEFAVELLKDLVEETRTTYNNNVYSYSAAAQAVGAENYELLTGSWWYQNIGGGVLDKSRVYPPTVAYYIRYSRGLGKTGPALIDIEEWDSRTEQEQMLRNIELASSAWRMGGGRETGIYKILPHADYWAPIYLKRALDGNPSYSVTTQSSIIARNMRINNQTEKRLGKYVDFLCPRCYVSYNNATAIAEWKWYATLSVMEALRCCRGKPVYPIVWYYAASDSVPLDEEYWIESLQYIAALPGISGIFIYSGLDDPTEYIWTDAIEDLVAGTGDNFTDS